MFSELLEPCGPAQDNSFRTSFPKHADGVQFASASGSEFVEVGRMRLRGIKRIRRESEESDCVVLSNRAYPGFAPVHEELPMILI
jgi:hypothetical protein